MSITVKGKVLQVLPIQTGQGKKGPWAKQDAVLDLGGQYPRKLCVSIWGQENIDKYDLERGLEITAHIELESKEYQSKWYTEVRAWKIEWVAQEARRWQPGAAG